jgi:hypothetical protein
MEGRAVHTGTTVAILLPGAVGHHTEHSQLAQFPAAPAPSTMLILSRDPLGGGNEKAFQGRSRAG